MKSLSQVFDSWWQAVFSHVNAALLFIDDAAAECLHWHGGLSRALDSGAVGVRNFSIFEKVSPAFKKAVFIITSSLTDDVLRTLMVLIQSNSFRNCVLISSSPLVFHDSGKPDGEKQFSNLENEILNWMGNMNYSAEVLCIPVFGFCLLPEIFIMPSLSSHFQPIVPEFTLEDLVKKKESGLQSLSDDIQKSIKMLSFCLSALLESLQLKGEIFSLGPLSHITGIELENMCHLSKRKAYSNKASVLLVDRSLDLAGPLSQTMETPLSKMLRVLPHLPGHICDVRVCMSDLAKCTDDTVFGLPLLAPGCIAHRSSPLESDNLTTILTSKLKEAVIEINRRVVQVGVKEGMSFDSVSASAPKALKKRILSYREKPNLLSKNSGLLQQALSIVQILEHPNGSHLDNLLATEKLLVQNFSLSGSSIADDIERLIANRKERGYEMADILTLIAFLYALSNEEVLDSDSETATEATIMEALFQDDDDSIELIRKLAGDDTDDQDTLTAVKTLFHVFRDFRNYHKDLKRYHSIFESGDPALPASYTALLKQIIESILNSTDMSDMEFHSTGLRDYIKTGFSLFMNVGKPQPKDNPVVIIIVLGGITASEIKAIHDLTFRHKTPKVIVGSTSLLTPESVMDNVFSVVKEISNSYETMEDF